MNTQIFQTAENGLSQTNPTSMTTEMNSQSKVKMSNHNNKTTNYKKKTIVFVRTDEYELDFEEWYEHKKGDFKTEADALEQWAAMCDGTDGKVEMEPEAEIGWDEIEDQCDEIQCEYETTYYDQYMDALLYDAVNVFDELGVEFYRDHSCCQTCGHAEAEDKNYVFYHAQDTESLRKGERSVHLAFKLDDEHKAKVLEMIAKQPSDLIRFHWSGEDHTRIFLTCDADEMAKYIKEDEERQVRMKKIAEEKRLREKLAKEEAEMNEKGIPTFDQLLEYVKRGGPEVEELKKKFDEFRKNM